MNASSLQPRCWFIGPLAACAGLVARLPQPVLLAAGTILGGLLWPLLGKRRRYARINIDLCFPELDAAARRRMLRRNMRNTAIGLLEMVRALYAPDKALAGLYEVEGLHHLQAAVASGRGVMLYGGHFPFYELALRLLGHAFGQRMSLMARRNNNACIEALMNGARRQVFAHVIDKKGVHELLDVLGGGGVVLYLADQNFTYQNAFVPFFGVPASTLTATPSLAQRADAVVLPFWFHRDEEGRYRLRIEATWPGWPSGDLTADAARCMAGLEAAVREKPDQYLWIHRRFKTRPAGEAGVYR